jgi:hypothetical protein
MTLDKLIADLVKLQAEGHGSKPVFYSHGSSGETGDVGSAHISDYEGDAGPFEGDHGYDAGYKQGDEYVSLYVGH